MAGTLYNIVHAEPGLSALTPGLRTVVGPWLARDPAARPAPEQLLALLGPVAPADRSWPPVVHRTIAAQRSGIGPLLGDTDRTLVPDPAPAAPAVAATVLLRPTPGPTQFLPPPRRRTAKTIALASTCALAVAGIGFGVNALKDKETAAEPNNYVKAPICGEMAGRLPLAARASCALGKVSGDPTKFRLVGLTDTVHAFVSWNLKRDDKGENREAEEQRKTFRADAAEESPATGLGFGDEAYWSAPARTYPDPQEHCSLYVRDGNLVVHVALGGDEHPASTCTAEAKKIARAAITAMPR